MADEDFMYDDDEGYDFEYEEGGDEDMDEGEMDIENKYYTAKSHRDEDADAAMREFQSVVDDNDQNIDHQQSSNGPGEYGFKATKQMIKLCLARKDFDGVSQYYDKMMDYVRKSLVTRNYAENSINNMLERVGTKAEPGFAYTFYNKTLEVLKATKNDRLWLRTSLRLANLQFEQKQYQELEALLQSLSRECFDSNGNIIVELGTQLMEINAIYLDLYATRHDNKRLKDIYLQCMGVTAALPHPRTMGCIRESGGKMYMRERNWEDAKACFFDAFKNYEEAGSSKRIDVLKYMALASLLSESDVDPLSSRDTQSYAGDPGVAAIESLVRAFDEKDINRFEDILNKNRAHLQDDPFINDYIDDLRRTVRIQALQAAVVPYTRIRIEALATRLQMPTDEAEKLLMMLILDNRIQASIDQEQGVLLVHQNTKDEHQYLALSQWASSLALLITSSLETIK